MTKLAGQKQQRFAQVLESGFVFAAAAAVLVALLVSFFLVFLLNMDDIDSQTEDLKDHPYAVTVATGRMETLLMQVKTLDSRLAFSRSPSTVSSVRTEFAVVNAQIEQELASIKARYRADPEKANQLASLYESFKLQQDELIEKASADSADAELSRFLTEEIDARIEEMTAVNAEIFSGATRAFDDLFAATASTRAGTMVTLSVLMVAVMAVLGVCFVVIKKKNKQQEALQESLRLAFSAAQEANEAKSRFLSNISHDIRTPLTAIIGLTDIACDNGDDRERVGESLGKIKLSSRHLLNLVNNVLDMSKIESGQVELNCEPFDVRMLVQTTVAIMEPQAEAKSIAFSVDRCELGDRPVLGDKIRVSQILINLLGNAVKYTEFGGHVRFSAVDCTTEGAAEKNIRVIRFIVEDDGIGMSEKFLSRIFDPFERENTPARGTAEGTGLGMSIAKSLIDLMGGTIEVRSEQGLGSYFTVDMPFELCMDEEACSEVLRVSEEVRLASAANSGACAKASDFGADSPEKVSDFNLGTRKKIAPSWGHARVLLAEDNEIIGEIAEELIARTGAEIDRAWDGLEAVEMVRAAGSDFYDLIFMDVQMPRMDGLAAARAIVADFELRGCSHPPIIAMTANAYVEDRARAFEAGVDGYAVKPIDADGIARLFEKYVKPSDS